MNLRFCELPHWLNYMDTKVGKVNVWWEKINAVLIIETEILSLKTSGKLPSVAFGLHGRASIESRLFKP